MIDVIEKREFHSLIEPADLSDLWAAHADRLLLIARSVGGPAEDGVQEAFVSLASQAKMPDDPLAWLARVCRNYLLQCHRSDRRRHAREIAREIPWFDDGTIKIDEQLDASEVTTALQSLNSPEREVIVMHLWGEMTFESIAEVIGGSRATSQRHFQRGLQALKTKFNESPTEAMRL